MKALSIAAFLYLCHCVQEPCPILETKVYEKPVRIKTREFGTITVIAVGFTRDFQDFLDNRGINYRVKNGDILSMEATD